MNRPFIIALVIACLYGGWRHFDGSSQDISRSEISTAELTTLAATVKPGDVVTIKGFRARDGSHLAACTTVTFPDGREISAGPTSPSQGDYGAGTNNKKK